MEFINYIIITLLLVSVNSQRPSFAGRRVGTGYKDGLLQQTTNNDNLIGNRNSENDNVNAIQNLPIDAHGDADLVNYWNSVPFEQRPFWLVNYKQIEAHRNTPTKQPINNLSIHTNLNTPNFVNRINTESKYDQFGFNINKHSTNSNQNSAVDQLDIVYPINIRPEQRIRMEIQFHQQRQAALQTQQQQQQFLQSNQRIAIQ